MRKADLDALSRTPDAILSMLPGAIRRGPVYWSTCPVHAEKSGSLQVSKRKGRWRWKCFGCGEGGDAVDLKRATAGIGFHDACRALGVANGDDERPPATESELDAYRQRMVGTMPLPLPPWATGDFVILYCGCGGTTLNRPRAPAPFRREQLECGRCALRAADDLEQAGPRRQHGGYGRTVEGEAWALAFASVVRLELGRDA
jgi:hypothetical protein